MSKRHVTPAIHIARRHQSAPATHWVDTEIMKAAVEIDEGRYVPEPSEDAMHPGLGLTLGLGQDRAAMGQKPTLEDFQNTRTLDELSRHPRVMEAMEKFQREYEEAKDPQQALEKSFALHEMTADQVEKDKWGGQERWEGEENRKMREGELLTPIAFYDRLAKVIGTERVLLYRKITPSLENPRAGRVGLYIKNPLWKPAAIIAPVYAASKADEIRQVGLKELRKAQQLRKAGHNALADAAFDRAGEMAKGAAEILMSSSMDQQLAEPEFLRVGTLQTPLGTEWMIMDFDDYGVPTQAAFLGWRTALLTMIRAGCITEREAHKAFPVGTTHAADWYRQQLKELRDQGKTIN